MYNKYFIKYILLCFVCCSPSLPFKLHRPYIQICHPVTKIYLCSLCWESIRLMDKKKNVGFLLETIRSAETKVYEHAVRLKVHNILFLKGN